MKHSVNKVVIMSLEASDLVEVKYEVEEEGEDEVDCYPGLTSSQITLGDDVLFRLNDCQATGPEPGIEPWEGDGKLSLQFEDKGKWKKRGYTYSEKLNKLYIEMGKPVAVRFSLDSSVVNLRGTVVRALPVYLETLHRHKPVTRCPVHSSPDDPSNTSAHSAILKHLVRTSEPESVYEENPSSGRLSTVVRTKQAAPGCDYFTVSYQFMCLGSCMGGIGRRPICLVLTLESDQGDVLGRQVVELRICTCPLRDMQQDEQKKTRGDCTPVKAVPSIPSLPSVTRVDSTSLSYNEDLYYVPVRGYRNFEIVNKIAESLDLSQRDLLSEEAERVRAERTRIVRARNPSLTLYAPTEAEQSPVKKRRLEVIASPQTRYLVPIMPKAKLVTTSTSLLIPRSNTIVLPPRAPLGQAMFG